MLIFAGLIKNKREMLTASPFYFDHVIGFCNQQNVDALDYSVDVFDVSLGGIWTIVFECLSSPGN